MNGVNPNSFTNMSSNFLNAYLSRFITRMFNELDLAELQRVQKFKTAQSLNGKKFDIDALFASFFGNSFLSVFEDRIHLLQAIFKYIEAK